MNKPNKATAIPHALNSAQVLEIIRKKAPEMRLDNRQNVERALRVAMTRSPKLRVGMRQMMLASFYGVRTLQMPTAPLNKQVAGAMLSLMEEGRRQLNGPTVVPIGLPRLLASTGHRAVEFGMTTRELKEGVGQLTNLENLGDRIDLIQDLAMVALGAEHDGAGALLEVHPIYSTSGSEREVENQESLNDRGLLYGEELDELTRTAQEEYGLNLAEFSLMVAGNSRGNLQSAQIFAWIERRMVEESYVYRPQPEEGRLPDDVFQFLMELRRRIEFKLQARLVSHEFVWAGSSCGTMAAVQQPRRESEYEPVDLPSSYPSEPEWKEFLDRQMGGLENIDPAMVVAAQKLIDEMGSKRYKPTLEAQVLKLLRRERFEWKASAQFHRTVHTARAVRARFRRLSHTATRTEAEDKQLDALVDQFRPELMSELLALREANAKIRSDQHTASLVSEQRRRHAYLEACGYITRQADRDLVNYVSRVDPLKVAQSASTTLSTKDVARLPEPPQRRPRARQSGTRSATSW